MTTTIDEQYGRRLSDKSAELVYLITGTTSAIDARALAAASAPPIYHDLPRDDIEVEEIEGLDDGVWETRVRYGYSGSGQVQVGDSIFGFRTSGANTHIKSSLATVGAYGDGAATTDNGGLIEATNQTVQGTDIVVPVYQWTIQKTFDPAQVTLDYRGDIFRLTGKVNDAAFGGTQAGETLFLGATGRERGADPWTITFHFASSPNKSDLTIGVIGGITKKGWEYLWVRYQTTTANDALTQFPKAVYVEKVYEEGDFSVLGV